MSRIYANCKEAMNEIKRNLYELSIEVHPDSMQNINVHGNDEYNTKELQNECFTIINSSDKDEIVGKDLDWCRAEFEERVSRQDNNPGKAWELRKSVWSMFMKNGKHDYTYSERMKDQIDPIISELKKNPDSRQCVLELHRPDDIKAIGGKARMPCSLEYVFQIRKDGNGEKKLNITYIMRSCDYYTHFKNDIWLACELRDYIAKQVGIKSGKFTMFITSLHMYKKDWEAGVF